MGTLTQMRGQNLENEFIAWRDHGDTMALACVFDALAPELLLIAMHLVRASEDAEDVVQETFVSAIESAGEYRVDLPIRPWLIGILSNRARRVRRARARRPDPERVQREAVVDPADHAAVAEVSAAVTAAIENLPEDFREALTLHWVHGLTPTQIGQAKGISPNTIKTRLFRARRAIEKALPVGITGSMVTTVVGSGMAAGRAKVLATASLVTGGNTAASGDSAGHSADVGNLSDVGVADTMAKTIAQPGGLSSMLVIVLVGMTLAVAAWATGMFDPDPERRMERAAIRSASPLGPAARVEAPSLADQSERTAVASADGAKTGYLVVDVRYARDGSPAVDVGVRAVPRRRTNAALYARRVRTDAVGHAVLGEWTPGPIELIVGRGGSVVTTVSAGVTETTRLTIPLGKRVHGIVVDFHSKPVAGAEVLIAPGQDPGLGLVATRTDIEGRFELLDVAADRFLSAAAPGFAVTTLHSAPAADEALELRFNDPGLRVTGRFVTIDSEPIADALVMIGLGIDPTLGLTKTRALRPPRWTRTAADGSFAFTSVPAKARLTYLWARKPGFVIGGGHVTLDPRRGGDFQVITDQGAVIEGTVRDDEGRPAAGARVGFRDAHLDAPELGVIPPGFALSYTFTDQNGKYRIEDVPEVPVHATAVAAEGGHQATAILKPTSESPTTWSPQLQNVPSLQGFVIDSEGVPISGLQVAAYAPWPVHDPRPATTDARGWFEIPNPSDTDYQLSIRALKSPWRAVLFTRRGVRPTAGPVELVVSRSQLPSATVRGRIVDHDGRPPTKYIVEVENRQGLHAYGKIKDGWFAVGPVPASSYRVRVLRRDATHLATSGWHSVQADAELDVPDLHVPATGRLRVTTLDPAGQPVRADVTLVLADGSHVGSLRDAAGSAKHDAGPGTSQLAVSAGDYRLLDRYCVHTKGWVAVRVTAGLETSLQLRRPPTRAQSFEIRHADHGGNLQLRYVLRSGERVLRRWTGFWEHRGSDVQTFTKHFPVGSYELEVVDQLDRRARVAFQVDKATAGKAGALPGRPSGPAANPDHILLLR